MARCSRGGHLGDLLQALEGLKPDGATDLARGLQYVSEVAQRRSLVIVLSDLLEAERAGERSEARHLLRGLRARKHDVVVFHVLDRDELTLPFEGTTVFESLEDDRRLLAEPADVRRAYLAELDRFIDGYRHGLEEGDVEYHLVDTSRPPSSVLLDFLNGAWRNKGRR
jgi:hypothetical protein